MPVSGYLKPAFFEKFLSASVWDKKTVRIYLCKTPPCLPVPWKLNSPEPAHSSFVERLSVWSAVRTMSNNMRVAPAFRHEAQLGQWYARNSRPGHNEGGEMKFLWTCSLQAPVDIKTSLWIDASHSGNNFNIGERRIWWIATIELILRC